MKVLIAVGHGRTPSGSLDPGTTSGSKTEQSEGDPIVVAAAKRLRDLGIEVRAIRAGGPNWQGAAQDANAWGADCAVEVHHDWERAPRGGFAHWFPGSTEGKRLADAIRDAVAEAGVTGHRRDWHRARNLGFNRTTSMPALLWECDRIGTVQDHVAYGRAIADGISVWGGIDLTPPSGRIHRVIVDGTQVGAYRETDNILGQVREHLGKRIEVHPA